MAESDQGELSWRGSVVGDLRGLLLACLRCNPQRAMIFCLRSLEVT